MTMRKRERERESGAHYAFLFVPLISPYRDLRQNEITDVEDGSFSGLTHLEELILFQNRLREIRPGMFKGLKNLKTL